MSEISTEQNCSSIDAWINKLVNSDSATYKWNVNEAMKGCGEHLTANY